MRIKNTSRLEIAAVIFIMLAAMFLRFYQLTTLPAGLHGDEAVPAIEAQRILDQGYIGPYSPLALGQPTGPMYFLAPFLKLFGNTIWAVRAFAAITGSLTVLLFYILLRRNFGHQVAVIGALLLAITGWHIHFSRIGFPLISWPLYAILSVIILAEALRRNDWRWWALAGASAGVGVYSYNAHLLFIGVLVLFCLWHLGTLKVVPAKQRLAWLVAFGTAGIVVALPLILYILNPAHDYFSHTRILSIFEQPEWKSLTRIGPKVGFLLGRYLDFWDIMVLHPQFDSGDGTGIVPVLSPLLLILALAGIVTTWRRRGPLLICAALIILLMPLASVITTAGQARRTFALLPFLILFAALALVNLYNNLALRSDRSTPGLVAGAVPAFLILFLTWQNVSGYFGTFARAPEQANIFAAEFTDAVKWMKTLPRDSYVYLSSDAIPFAHETRRYLAPEVPGEDRASRFTPRGLDIDPARGKAVFVFIGANKSKLGEVQRLYPGGETIDGATVNNATMQRPTFMAYCPKP